jgi:MYXO-CTERM domain-containing protein
MTAAVLDDPATAQDDTAGLALHLVTRRAGKNAAAVTPVSVSAGTEALDTSGTSELWVAVVNGAVSGASRKPLLCMGTPAEVADCREGISPSALDAGVHAPDAGTDSPGGGAPGPTGCGCAGTGMDAAWGWLGLLGLVLRRRREP